MKSILILSASLIAVTGCSAALRSPEMYRDDTKKVLDTREADIKACYDGVLKSTPGVGGKVTVKFDVETEGGKFTNIQLDPGNTTAPPPVAECVTKNLAGLKIDVPDAKTGQASAVWEFSQPPAPPTAPPPPPKG